jgi:hypothetical protein
VIAVVRLAERLAVVNEIVVADTLKRHFAIRLYPDEQPLLGAQLEEVIRSTARSTRRLAMMREVGVRSR